LWSFSNRYWKDESGIGRASGSAEPDLNATAMAFRLLRTHGFDVKEDCFRQFYNDMHCPNDALTAQPVDAMLSLFRASQTMFPGEALLKEARTFTQNFLQKHLESCKDRTLACKVRTTTHVSFPLSKTFLIRFSLKKSRQKLGKQSLELMHGYQDLSKHAESPTAKSFQNNK
jgi:hypothetical protein